MPVVAAIVSADSADTVVDNRDPVVITAQPAIQTVDPGASASFTVKATGYGALTYQWKKGATSVAGATSATYTIGAAAELDEGSYSVVVTNAVGSVTSSAAVLSVNDPVVITAQPVDRTVNPGASVSFTVTATGSSLSYQWRKGGVNISGATSATYTITPVVEVHEGNYDVVVSNSVGSVTSSAVLLSVNDPVVITAQPVSQGALQGASASFSVTAAGTGSLTYQWKLNGTNISGATSANYTIGSVNVTHAGTYACEVTNVVGAVISNGAVLTVGPAITAQPVGATVNPGTAASLNVTATGSSLSYQWRKGGVNISGAMSATYTINPVTESHEGNYDVLISNSVGSVTSSAVLLSVNDPVVITAQPVSQGALQGAAASFSVTAAGTGSVTYQWKLNGTNISGATSATYAIASVNGTHAGTYTCAVSNVVGTVISNGAVLTVGPAITVQPVGATVNPGASVNLNVTATGSLLGYQWRKGGVNISGATSATYTITPVVEVHEGNYDVVVSNSVGSVTSSAVLLSVNDPVVITAQPVSQGALQGASASFNVTATGTAPLTYQWKLNGTNISGATSATYAIASVNGTHAGTYTCAVSNVVGTVVSNGAVLTVGPAIAVQPVGTTVNPGAAASFTVTASGSGPISYQWTKGGVDIAGATQATYSVGSVVEANEGSYSVRVSNALGALTSNAALLSVNDPVGITTQPASQSVFQGMAVSFNVAAIGTGPLSYQWKLNGTNIAGANEAAYRIAQVAVAQEGTYTCAVSNVVGTVVSSGAVLMVGPAIATQPSALTVNPGAAASFTVGATGSAPLFYQWLKGGVEISGATSATYTINSVAEVQEGSYSVRVSNALGALTSASAVLSVNDPVVITQQPVAQSALQGFGATFTVVATGTGPLTYQWRKDGVNIAGATAATYTVASVTGPDTATYTCAVGNAVGTVISNGAALTVGPAISAVGVAGAPVFSQVPGSYTWAQAKADAVARGGRLAVVDTSTKQAQIQAAGLYGWIGLTDEVTEGVFKWVDGTGLSYSNWNSGEPNGVRTENYVHVFLPAFRWNDSTSTRTDIYILEKSPSVALDGSVNPGSQVTFTVTATGSGPLSYQWQKDGVVIAGATAATYTIPSVSEANEGSYSVRVSNVLGALTSGPVVLSVNDPVIITAQPAGLTVNPGNPASLTVAATGTGPLSYQWYRSGVVVDGATSATYALSSVAEVNEGSYTAVVTNAVGSVTSAAALLSVNDPVVISVHPASRAANPGTATTFSVTAAGTAPLGYQWRRNGVPIGGATSSSYVLTPVMEAQEGSYDVVVSNVVGSVTSAAATLTVNDPVLITAQPQSHAAISGVPATFTVAATGTGPLIYQWRRNGVPVGGAVGTSFTLVLPNKADEGVYTCAVTNVAGTVVTNEAQLTVNDFAITAQPVARAVMPGGSASFSVAATGVSGPAYQWRLNGVNIPGATGPVYAIGAVVAADAGVYSCLVTSGGGMASSLGAALTVGPAITVQPVGTTVNAGSQLGLSVSVTGSAPFTYQWRRNGVAVVGGTQASYVVASALGADAGSYDVVVSNAAGSVQSSVVVVGVVDPLIVTQPGALTVNPGTRATFSVVAAGTGPLSYQWRRNGADIAGATAASYTIASAADAHEGTYSVVVGSGVGAVTSLGAALIVNDAVVISGQPVALGLMPGASASFSVTASGTGPLVYQWKRNGSAIVGADGAVYMVGSVSAAHAGTYTCEVGNVVGSAVSNGAVLSVGPAIVSQPQAQTVNFGAMASLSVAAVGDGPLNYQWRRNGTDIEGATNAAYTVAPAAKTHEGSYTVVVRNAVGSVTSVPAALRVFQTGAVTFATREIRRLKAPGELAVPVTLRREGGSDGVATVRMAVVGGTLASASYQLPDSPTEVTWGDGDAAEKNVTLTVRASAVVASDGDTVVLGLQAPTGAALGEVPACTVSLRTQKSGVLGFVGSTLERVKPASGDLSVDVVVSRMQGSTGAVSAEVVVAGGTALASDYTVEKPVRLEWADGDPADKTFPVVFRAAATVPVAGKTVQFKLQNLTGGALLGGVEVATLVVRGATVAGTLNFSSATYAKAKAESGDTLVPVSVSRVLGGNGAVSVQVAVTGGTASGVDDYTMPGSPVTLSWADDEMGDKSFNIVVKAGAQIAAAGETILLKLQGATGGAVLGKDAAATVTLTSADTAAPVLVMESPADKATVTGESVLFKGKATDVSGVTRVEVTLNNDAPQEATLTTSANGNTFGWMVTLVPEQGANTVKVQAFDSRGNASAMMSRTFTFLYLRPDFAGVYDGLLSPATDAASFASDHADEPQVVQTFAMTRGRGLFTASVSATGAFTGKVSLAGTAASFKGVLKKDGTAVFDGKNARLELAKGAGAARSVLGYLSFHVDDNGDEPRLVGELATSDGEVEYAGLSAEKAVYSAAKVLPAGMRRVPVEVLNPGSDNGRYTALFEPRFDEGLDTNGGLEAAAFPQAPGYAKITVTSSGVVTVVGKLADGTAVSYSNRLSSTNGLPFYVPLYTNRGFLAGRMEFDDAQVDSDASCMEMSWLRPSGLAAPYAAGWPEGIAVDLVGSKYVPPTKATTKVPTPANPYTVFGAELPVNAVLGDAIADFLSVRTQVSEGGLSGPLSSDAKLNAASVFAVTGATAGETGVTGLKLSFTSADGGFTGSFTHPVTNKAAAFSGVVLQKAQRGAGFFPFAPPAGGAAAVGAVDVVVP